jgi:hypothetical protein
MSEQVLTVLKFCLLALLYLFLARVLWVVVRELRGTPLAAPRPGVAPTPVPAATGARSARRGWRLVVVRPDSERGQEYWIDGDATVGRGGGCTITLAGDTFVSQVHARLHDRDGTLWLEDLESTNGTFVNGKPVTQPVKLSKGDHVQIGETLFEAARP